MEGYNKKRKYIYKKIYIVRYKTKEKWKAIIRKEKYIYIYLNIYS